jgi:hypothetical protein
MRGSVAAAPDLLDPERRSTGLASRSDVRRSISTSMTRGGPRGHGDESAWPCAAIAVGRLCLRISCSDRETGVVSVSPLMTHRGLGPRRASRLRGPRAPSGYGSQYCRTPGDVRRAVTPALSRRRVGLSCSDTSHEHDLVCEKKIYRARGKISLTRARIVIALRAEDGRCFGTPARVSQPLLVCLTVTRDERRRRADVVRSLRPRRAAPRRAALVCTQQGAAGG